MAIGFGFASPQARAYAVWDDAPGGTIVGRYTDPLTEVEYLFVEFEGSPGVQYVYYAE